MKMTRRQFNVGAFTIAIFSSVLMAGCNVMQDIVNWIPVGIGSVNALLNLLSAAGIVLGPGVTLTIGLIQAGFADLQNAILEYQATTPPPAGTLAKIDTFLSDLVSNWQNVVNQLPPLTGSLVSLVAGLIELVISTIQGFINGLPPATSAQLVKTKRAFRPNMPFQGQTITLIAVKRSRRQYVREWNKLVGEHKEARLHDPLF